MNDDPIGTALNLSPVEKITAEVVEVTPSSSTTNNSVTDDFDIARSNILDVIQQGQEALAGIIDVAKMSQHPRSYEVVADLMNSVVSANKDLLELQKRKKALLDEGPQKQVTNNNLFVGNTAELLKMIKSSKKQED